jgi:hypothetical protein
MRHFFATMGSSKNQSLTPLPQDHTHSLRASPNAAVARNKTAGAMTREADVLIVGAGPAGLAMGGALKRLHPDVSCILVDGADKVGKTWHSHYDRLHLHSSKQVGTKSMFYSLGSCSGFLTWQLLSTRCPTSHSYRFLSLIQFIQARSRWPPTWMTMQIILI